MSQSFTIFGFGLGIWIPTLSVPGIGAMILSDLDLRESLMSFSRFSIAEILIPWEGLILICTMEGPISNPSTETGIQNSNNFFSSDFAFSTMKF